MFFNTYDQCLAVLKFTACTSQSKRWRTQKKFRPRTKTGNFQIKEIQRSIECVKGFSALFEINGASLATQTAHAPLAVQETQVQSLGREDPLEKGMAAHSSVLAWRTPWTEEPGGLQSVGSQRVRHNWSDFFFSLNPWKDAHKYSKVMEFKQK